ncbi:MAG: flagellar biosynthesis anti-sigma factor FlgM [Candidatus Tectomicrobia bacterium]|uniref:Negative regulator of flagellin synthesis n=1 Tax=Tectimicrobiota bacterium TaxID=2528274 RepID=A0A932I3N0_UNCTE|nr:flagellar biosynthesis anti-sigma factor FlgM [Candidatus Tectomicrobia bacterium]
MTDLDPIRRKISGEAYTESLRKKEKAEQARGGGQKASAGGAAQEGERVEVSDKALMLSRIQRALAEIADVRADLVAEIRARIERDEYHVQGEVIADKVIRDALKEMKSIRRG